MNRCVRSLRIAVIGAMATGFAAGAFAGETSWDGLWITLDSVPANHASLDAWIRPDVCQPVTLNMVALKEKLKVAPLEDTPDADRNAVVITLPTPEGTFHRFRIVDSPIMEQGLADQFPEIKTYMGQGIDDPTAVVRLDTTPAGFHAQVLAAGGAGGGPNQDRSYWIDPYTKNDTVLYTSYHKSGLRNTHGFACFTTGHFELPAELKKDNGFNDRTSGATRRQYRLANACTGEYALAVGGGTVAGAQAAIVTAINRVTGVYELECAIRLVLVANNTSILYTNGATDPYTNNNGGTMLGQNQTNLTTIIGSANYDIGHVFSTGGGGVAGLGVVCKAANKAWGVTGLPSPTGDPFYIDYVAHEMGHQFGGNHNFNGTGGNCSGGNRNASTAYEVGSATTIMGYAGICSPDDTQSNSSAYFGFRSHEEILAYAASQTCSSNTATGNNFPVVDAGLNYTIPANTPFALTPASSSDADGDVLTYCWEENDLGVAQGAVGGIFIDNGTSPFIRSYTGTTNPTRTIPNNTNLRANTFAKGERLPVTNRAIKFKCTVRDNRAGTGGVFSDTMTVTSTTAAGPFVVTFPNAAGTQSGSITVTWNVTSTNAAPVNCANVRVLLSTDGGITFPTVLLASTPNTGSAVVTLPTISTTTARVRVEAVGNIFFDISNANFTITPGLPATPTSVLATPGTVCNGQTTQLTATVGSGETVRWYTGSCGGTLAGSGSPLVVSPAANTTYFARAQRNSDSVFSTNCGSVAVVVNLLAVTPTSASSDRTNFCASDTGTISLTAAGGSGDTLRWYSGSCGGTFVGTGAALVISSPTTTTTYFARWENGCGNSACVSVVVTVRSADFNGDGFVTGEDFDAYVVPFEAGDLAADYNGDGFVTGEDFDAYVTDFEAGC